MIQTNLILYSGSIQMTIKKTNITINVRVKGNPNSPSTFDTHVKPNIPVCKFYANGKCRKGNSCGFRHEKQTPVPKSDKPYNVDIGIFKNPKKPDIAFNWRKSQNSSIKDAPPPPPEVIPKSPRKPTIVVIYRNFTNKPKTQQFNSNNTFYY